SSKFRVLVVEDEWPARNFLVELLEESGQATVMGAVASVAEAMQALGNSSATLDVAFMDVNLVGDGERAGLDVVRRYCDQEGAPAFVLATAFREHAIEAFDLGVVDYLVKPFTEERVAACLTRIAQRRAPSPSAAKSGRVVAREGKNLIFLDVDEIWA